MASFAVMMSLSAANPRCGLKHMAQDGHLWNFDLDKLKNITHMTNAPRTSPWVYNLQNPCQMQHSPCRPATCPDRNPDKCHPLNASRNMPVRGILVQVEKYGTVPVFPAPTPEQQCRDANGQEVACTPLCNVLAPQTVNHTWNILRWSPQFYNSGILRLKFGPQNPPNYWDEEASLQYCDGEDPRQLTIDFICDATATPPRLYPPSDVDTKCGVQLVVRTSEICFSFAWRVGPWSACQVDEGDESRNVRTRSVECRERRNLGDAPGDCDSYRKPSVKDFASCAHPSAPVGLRGGGLALLLTSILLLIVAVAMGAHAIVKNHSASVQRRRLLAMTLHSQACEEVETMGDASSDTYFAKDDSGL